MTETKYNIAVLHWPEGADGLQQAFGDTLEEMGHIVDYVDDLTNLNSKTEIVLIFGPYGKFLGMLERLEKEYGDERPVVICWNTEGLPDLSLPTSLVGLVARVRSWIGRVVEKDGWIMGVPGIGQVFRLADKRLFRFRYLGDYLYASKKRCIDVYADISDVYMKHYASLGLTGTVAPFGSYFGWHEDLGLERDIDVIWLGKRATRRRSELLDRLKKELANRDIEFLVFDGEERDFVFDDERTRLLNRSKITVNLLRTWYDEHTLRFCIVMPNRTMVVSEPILPHVPDYIPGEHYISVAIDEMADKIQYYLENDEAREQIVDQAYELMTKQVTMERSVNRILEAACPFLEAHKAGTQA